MRVRILFEISPSDDFSLEIGRVMSGGEILSWNYQIPTNTVEYLREAKKLLEYDATRVYSFLSEKIKYSKLITASLLYRIETMRVFYVENRWMCVLTLTCVSLIAAANILSSGVKPTPIFTNTPVEYRAIEVENSRTYTIAVDTTKVSSKSIRRVSKAHVVAKSTKVKKVTVSANEAKGYEVLLPLKAQKLRPVSSNTMSAFASMLDKELNSSISDIKAETYVNLLLNYSEGFYPVPYWDNKQYSVGFGTFISRVDCEVMWARMGLSSTEGNKLAWQLHELGKKNYKKAKALSDSWIGKPGTMNVSKAEDIRDKEMAGFLRSVKKQYPDMSYFQQLVLASTIYNTGWAGYIGGNFSGKIFPVSDLARVLAKGDYSSPDIKWAYMKLKVPTKGHVSRRQREMRAFLSFSSVEERKKTIGHLTEAMAFDKKIRKS